jgi:hypothetical protein
VALADLTSRDAVLAAMEEFDKLGRDQFLERYHFRRARDYEVVHGGKRYDSKAIVGAAHGHYGEADIARHLMRPPERDCRRSHEPRVRRRAIVRRLLRGVIYATVHTDIRLSASYIDRQLDEVQLNAPTRQELRQALALNKR